MHLYGGFVGNGTGGNETARSQRDWDAHPATIDGSTARDGQPAYHVLVGDNGATLDGFRITGGNANGADPLDGGGGMYASSVEVVVQHCAFFNNSAATLGGGIGSFSGVFTVAYCTFSGNSGGGYGGGICSSPTSMLMVHASQFLDNSAVQGGALIHGNGGICFASQCTFIGNTTAGGGGAISEYHAQLYAADSQFLDNTSDNDGGAVWVDSIATMANCLFAYNAASWGGALFEYYYSSDPTTIKNCTLASNIADGNTQAGALTFQGSGSHFVENSILWGNTAGQIESSTAVTVSYSDIQHGFPGDGNLNTDPVFLGGPSGTCTGLSYNPATSQSTLTDSGAAFTPGALAGTVLLLGASGDEKAYLITANDTTHLTFWGDGTRGGTLAAPVAYAVQDYRLDETSLCINAGTIAGAPGTRPRPESTPARIRARHGRLRTRPRPGFRWGWHQRPRGRHGRSRWRYPAELP